LHDAHHAVMLAVPAAAGGEIRVGIGAKEWRHQHPAEDDREQKCDYAAHGQETV
jgi:oxalate decarboxylase/phosphoglucose isomerase-like protein (cupin superfamily)